MGEETAQRMLGPEGWKPSANDWHQLGIVGDVVSASTNSDADAACKEDEQALLTKAQEVAEGWVAEAKGKRLSEAKREELKAVNARESVELATCFLSPPFLEGQYQFAKAKNKPQVANLFWGLKTFRPVWSLLL
jgi:enoyl-CoA hydratase/carnithine racemase